MFEFIPGSRLRRLEFVHHEIDLHMPVGNRLALFLREVFEICSSFASPLAQAKRSLVFVVFIRAETGLSLHVA